MKHHEQLPKTEGIPKEHQTSVCLVGQVGQACAALDYSHSDGVRSCSKGVVRQHPQGQLNTGEQWRECSGPPNYTTGGHEERIPATRQYPVASQEDRDIARARENMS